MATCATTQIAPSAFQILQAGSTWSAWFSGSRVVHRKLRCNRCALMQNESNTTFTIAMSGTLTIARSDLESLLRSTRPQLRDAEPNTQVAPPKVLAKDFGPPQRLAFSMQETADVLGVSYITVQRLIQRGLLRSSTALRHKIISKVEIERFLRKRPGRYIERRAKAMAASAQRRPL